MSKQFHPVNNVFDGIINTCSGKIDLLEPTPEMIRIEDIALALSNTCRFGGHVKKFYSVAQHSLFVAALAPKHLMREALLHDAAEAYVGDVVKPLKVLLGSVYENLEDSFMQAIVYKFGLDHNNLLAIKEYDKEAVLLEHKCFQKGDYNHIHCSSFECAQFLYAWEPTHAYQIFMNTFNELFLTNISIH